MPKYSCSPGKFTDMLGEEAAEVAQAIFKLNRFGKDGARDHGYTGPSPVEQLHQEVADFLVVVEHLVDVGLLEPEKIAECMAAKNARLRQLFDVDVARAQVSVGGRRMRTGIDTTTEDYTRGKHDGANVSRGQTHSYIMMLIREAKVVEDLANRKLADAGTTPEYVGGYLDALRAALGAAS